MCTLGAEIAQTSRFAALLTCKGEPRCPALKCRKRQLTVDTMILRSSLRPAEGADKSMTLHEGVAVGVRRHVVVSQI